ncbi:hypothetical protein D9M72_604740 [compost metagenome]
MPAESRPKIAGSAGSGRNGYHSGKWVVTFFRFGITPLAATLTSTSCGPGSGRGTSSRVNFPPISCRRAAFIIAIFLVLRLRPPKEAVLVAATTGVAAGEVVVR